MMLLKAFRTIALALVLVFGVRSEKLYTTAALGRRALQVWTSSFSPRILVANDPGLYSLSGLSQALESLLLQVDYVTDITAAGGSITRSNYDVVIFPKILSTTDFSNLYRILVTFLYDGGAVVLGPTPFDINITATFTQNMASQMSLYGDAGSAVAIDCGYAPVPIYMASNRSVNWNLSTTPTPGTWPDVLGAGAVSYNPSSYSANCGPLKDPVGGVVMYRDISGMGTSTVYSLPRGQAHFYYVGLDFDNDPRDGSWGQLLTSIAEQAASNPPSVNAASSPPLPSPPSSSAAAAPEEYGLYNTSLYNSTGAIFWPVGRGRVSYTASGLTASSALTSPPSPAAPRVSYLCHDLLVNGSAAAAANGSSKRAWVVIDLGTRRRVAAVRIQALEAGDDARLTIQGVAIGLEVRVGPTSADATIDPAYVNDPLCPSLEPVIVVGASVVSGSAAVDVSCGANNSLVGRYVSVQLRSAIPGATWARLCGVEVVGSLPASYALVSRNKPVCVDGYNTNSVNGGKSVNNFPVDIHPSLAVDGLYNDNRNTGLMCALSVLRQDPFFTLDLGASMAIERVEVTKSWRAEYVKQLANFSIVVGLVSCSGADNPLNDLVAAQAVVCASGLNLPPGSTGVYNCSGISGRYVTIATQGYYGYLRLCELDVYAAVPSSDVYRISVHKPVTASANYLDSLLPGQAAASNKSVTGLLVDGVTPTRLRSAALGGEPSAPLGPACVVAASQGSPWLQINLGGSFLVKHVQIHFSGHFDDLNNSYTTTTATSPTTTATSLTGYKYALDVRLGNSAMYPYGITDPACVSATGIFTGLETSKDLYGSGENVRRYVCGYYGSNVTVAAIRTTADGNATLALPPLCEIEVLVASDGGGAVGYLASLGRYAAASDGSGGWAAVNATRALQNPNYLTVVPEDDRCVVATATPGSYAAWLVDLGSPLEVSMVELLSTDIATTVNVTLLNDTAAISVSAGISTAPLEPGSGTPLTDGKAQYLLPGHITRLWPAAIAAANIRTSNTTANSSGITAAASSSIGRFLMITNTVPDEQLRLCQVWAYGTVDGGVGSGGPRSGVQMRKVVGRVAVEVGSLPLDLSSGSTSRTAFTSAARSLQDAEGSGVTLGSDMHSARGVGSGDILGGSLSWRRQRILQQTPSNSSMAAASLILDLGLPRAVEIAVLVMASYLSDSGSLLELTNVVVSVSNSSTGSPGSYCAYDVTLALSQSRHVYGCGGAYGHYVVASRTVSYGLPNGTSLEAYLTDPGTQVVVSSLRSTSQSGAVSSGPGGSANAVNGYYSQAALKAAAAAATDGGAGLYFGSASAVVADPWWAVDLGAAMPLVWVEVTAHPEPTDGLGLLNFDITMSNFTVVTGTEGVAVLSGLSVPAGGTARFPLAGAAARQLILRQAGVVRSLQLAQVVVIADAAVVAASANGLISSKPLSYPLVYDMARTTGTYTDAAASSGNVTRTGELAPLAVDGYDGTAAGSCARMNSGTTGQVPWLLVDLVSSARVDRVDLLKAADPALASELDGVDVLLGNSTIAEDNPVVLSSLNLPQPGAWATFLLNSPATGRYLVVRRPVMGAAMTVCELQAYGASAFEMRLVPAPSPPPSPMPPPLPSPSPSPRTPPSALLSALPPPATSPSPANKGRGSAVLAGKVSTNPIAVTAVTASIVAVSIGTTVSAAMVASAAATATAAAAVGSAGGVIATSGASSAAVASAAGTGGALAFVGHMQFFALTANAAANGSGAYKDTNSQLSWLNLQFNTLWSVDLPDVEQQAYSQALNVAIAFWGVLLLHLTLVLLLAAIRKRVQRRREEAAATAMVVTERTGTDAVGMPAPPPSLPSLLVFPFLEIFIILFFMTSLAAAAGTLLAYGITEHRVGSAAVGVALLVLLVIFGVSVLWLLRRLYGAADRLGLSYIGAPRPPPPAGRENRLARLLRHSERGFWARPEGFALRLMEPHRTDNYLREGFSLRQALRATSPELLLHAHQEGPGELVSQQPQLHLSEGAADPAPAGAQAPPCIQNVSRDNCNGQGHTSRVQPQEGKERLRSDGPGRLGVAMAPAEVAGSQPPPGVRTTQSLMRGKAWGSFTSKIPAVGGGIGSAGGDGCTASATATDTNYSPNPAARPAAKGTPVAESVLGSSVSRGVTGRSGGGSVDGSSARRLLHADAGATEICRTDALIVFEEMSDAEGCRDADSNTKTSSGNFGSGGHCDLDNHVSAYFLPLRPTQLSSLKLLPPPPPPPLPPPPPPRPVLLPPLDLHSRDSSIVTIPLHHEFVPGSKRGPASIRSGSGSARPSLHGGVRASGSGSGARPEDHLAWMPSGNGTASGQVTPPPLLSEDSRESKWRPAFSMDDDSKGDDAGCLDAGIDRDVPGAIIIAKPKATATSKDEALVRPRSAAALALATPATSMSPTGVAVAPSPQPPSAVAAAAGSVTGVGPQAEGTDGGRCPRGSSANGCLPLPPPPPPSAAATQLRQSTAESETATVAASVPGAAPAESEIGQEMKPAMEASLSRRFARELSYLAPVCCSCGITVMCYRRGYEFNSATAAELDKAADAAYGRRDTSPPTPPATECSNTAPSVLQQLELYERYGQLFEEMKGRRFNSVTFQAAIVCNAVIPAVLLGAQAGAKMEPYSAAARGAIIALLVCKALFAFYMTLALPYSNVVTMGAELFCAWLEAAVCACLVSLQWIHRSEVSLSDAMLGCEITVFALQIVRVALTTVLPAILAIREEGCNLCWGWGCSGPPAAAATPQQPPAPQKGSVTR